MSGPGSYSCQSMTYVVCYCRQQRLEHLKKERPEICSWDADCDAFAKAVCLLCEVKVAAWQLKAEQLMRQHQVLAWMQRTAGDNCRTEVKQMRKHSTQLCRDMQSAVTAAAEWEQQRCKYQQQQQGPEQQYIGKQPENHWPGNLLGMFTICQSAPYVDSAISFQLCMEGPEQAQ